MSREQKNHNSQSRALGWAGRFMFSLTDMNSDAAAHPGAFVFGNDNPVGLHVRPGNISFMP